MRSWPGAVPPLASGPSIGLHPRHECGGFAHSPAPTTSDPLSCLTRGTARTGRGARPGASAEDGFHIAGAAEAQLRVPHHLGHWPASGWAVKGRPQGCVARRPCGGQNGLMEHVVGYQGEPGANSDEAARRLFPGARTIGLPTFAAVFAALVQSECQFAVLPVENSRAGVVQEVSDQLWDHPGVAVIGEQAAPIHHHLLAPDRRPVERALSHPQALAQCARWLSAHEVAAVPYPDTAGAARHVAETRLAGEGAIASLTAARLYGLEVVAEDIADEPSNQTRFVVVTDRATVVDTISGRAKLSLGLVAPHRPGGLVRVLTVFADLNLNLTRLDARPIPDLPFHYRFYLDAELEQPEQGEELLRGLAHVSQELRLFGIYTLP